MMLDNFHPIKGYAGDWSKREPGVRSLREDDCEEITALLTGHRVVKVDGEHLVLDNGTTIKAIGHVGGCSCGAGDYDLSVLNGVDNVITRVEFDYQPGGEWDPPEREKAHPDDPDDKWTGFYRVFVFADNQQINLMQFDGSDGNGYYGTGFELLVREVSA
jgi:hypothetical protein